MDSTVEIKSKLARIKKKLQEKYPIATMALFGSYARSEQTESSDVDIIVEFNGRIGSDFIVLAHELEKYLGKKVDLVSRKGIKNQYFNTIEQDLIYV